MVLEGGGLRGLYTAGVLDFLMENNVEVDGIIGVSAGALFGVNYFSKQKGRVIRYNKKYCQNKNYMSIRSLLLTGNYINKNFAFYKMTNELDQFDNLSFLNSRKDFYAVATKVIDGEAEYFKIVNPVEQLECFRASSAIPMLSKIVKIDGEGYLDGGVADSIPIDKCIELGYKKRIIVQTRPLNYRKTPFKKSIAALIKLKYFRYPKLVNAILTRYKKYNKLQKRIIDLEINGEAFVIRPSKKIDINIKNKDKEKYQEIYDMGVNDAKAALKDLIEYLKEKKLENSKTTKIKSIQNTKNKNGAKASTKNVSNSKKNATTKITTTNNNTTLESPETNKIKDKKIKSKTTKKVSTIKNIDKKDTVEKKITHKVSSTKKTAIKNKKKK